MVVILPMLPPELTLAPVHTPLPSDTRTQLVLLHQRIGGQLNQSSIVVVSFWLKVQKIIDYKVKNKMIFTFYNFKYGLQSHFDFVKFPQFLD